MTYACTHERFLADVATHALHIERDDGVYRHLRFRRPNTNCYSFDIITYPGHLVMSGDMGSWVFSRLRDMFEFFRADQRDGEPDKLRINTSYWSEKLEAISKGGVKEFSQELFQRRVREHVGEWQNEQEGGEWVTPDNEDEPEYQKPYEIPADLQETIDDLLRCGDDGEYAAHAALRDFNDQEKRIQFNDTWEWDLRQYTFHFIWACYAIAWSIKQYDAAKDATAHPVPGAIDASQGCAA